MMINSPYYKIFALSRVSLTCENGMLNGSDHMSWKIYEYIQHNVEFLETNTEPNLASMAENRYKIKIIFKALRGKI